MSINQKPSQWAIDLASDLFPRGVVAYVCADEEEHRERMEAGWEEVARKIDGSVDIGAVIASAMRSAGFDGALFYSHGGYGEGAPAPRWHAYQTDAGITRDRQGFGETPHDAIEACLASQWEART